MYKKYGISSMESRKDFKARMVAYREKEAKKSAWYKKQNEEK